MQNGGTIIAGKYELGKEIGKGGMSRVYLATDTRLNKVWAVKKVDKTAANPNKNLFINNLRKEVKLMEGLSYITIPRIVDIIEDTKTIYIVMDYIEGEGLDKILKIQGRQNEDDVIDWAKQLCETLIYLHSLKNPVIHRDIKPGNIVLQPGVQNAIKILDFGIAEKITADNSRNMQPVGTPGYMAPEQETKGVPYDIRSDIYSFGATLHHLLTGKIPKKDKEFVKLRAITGRVSENTEGLEYVIEKCLKKDPAERYQNCNELLFDLNRLPELSKEHRRKQANKVTLVAVIAVLSFFFALSSVLANIGYNSLARQNQSLYAENIYRLSNEIVDSYNLNLNDFVTILDKMESIEANLETSKKLSGNGYRNALVFSVYSISMWNINDAIQFEFGAPSELSEENTEAYIKCKTIFDGDFLKHLLAFANSIEDCADSQEVAVCICELNAFNTLFITTSEDSASGILQDTDKFITSNNFNQDINLKDSFFESFERFIKESESLNAFFQQDIERYRVFGARYVNCLNAFVKAKSVAKDVTNPKNYANYDLKSKKQALSDCLNQYTNVVELISGAQFGSYYKYLLYDNTTNYLIDYISDFKDNGIEKEELIGNDSLYSVLDNAITDLIENNSDRDFGEKCKKLKKQVDGIYRKINAAYNPTSSTNV